jgi:hypothetical protein
MVTFGAAWGPQTGGRCSCHPPRSEDVSSVQDGSPGARGRALLGHVVPAQAKTEQIKSGQTTVKMSPLVTALLAKTGITVTAVGPAKAGKMA